MKYELLKKKLIKIFIFVAIILAIFIGGAYYISDLEKQESRRLAAESSKLRNTNNKIQDIELKTGIIRENMQRYQQTSKSYDSGELSIDRQRTREILNDVKDEYNVNNLNMRLTPNEKLKAPGYETNNKRVDFRELVLEFDTFSDFHAVNFVKKIMDIIPGYLEIKELTIRKERELTDSVLLEIASDNKPRIVSAYIKFNWLGISSKDKKK